MQISIMRTWQKRRSAFNHDWLKNSYIVALGSFLNLLDNKIEDADLEHSFIPSILPQWEFHRAEAFALPRDFERQMSPQNLFDRIPLSRCDENAKEWLGNLIHAVWLTRYPVRCWVADVTTCAEDVDIAYDNLREALKFCSDVESALILRRYRKQFVALRERCQKLAAAIENFPNEVCVI